MSTDALSESILKQNRTQMRWEMVLQFGYPWVDHWRHPPSADGGTTNMDCRA